MTRQDHIPQEAKTRLHEKLERELGTTILNALKDPLVEDIARNSDGYLWIKRSGEQWERIEKLSDIRAENILRSVATSLETAITPQEPHLDGVLPIDGSRIHGNIPPEVRAASFIIRKRAEVIYTLDNYLEQETITQEQQKILINAIKTHKNIFVVGGTGSGKTTLVNALIDTAAKETPEDRFIIIEDTGEIQCAAPNTEQMFTTQNRTLSDLVMETLRMRPDRIIIGEVRGEEALQLLEIWNTGHSGGIATAHATVKTEDEQGVTTVTPELALQRIEVLVARSDTKLSNEFISSLIAATVDLVVCIDITPAGRKVTSISSVNGYDEKSGYSLNTF